MSKMNRIVWVTGGAGMIGSALVAKLIKQGMRVRVLDNFSRGLPQFVHKDAELTGLDLAYPIPHELIAEKPAMIFHLAARVGGVNYMIHDQVLSHRNAAVDWNVIEAALRCECPLLFCSTACIYPVRIQTETSFNSNQSVMLSEDMALRNGAEPESIYGWAKLLGELAVAKHAEETGADWHIVRMFNVYGPREVPSIETGHVIPALIRKMLTGEPPMEVWGTGRALRAFTYVDDAAEGIIRVMQAGRKGIPYNIGTDEVVSVAELATIILEAEGIPPLGNKLRFAPEKPEGVFGRGAICDRALNEIGWSPKVDLREGIQRTLLWCKRWLMENEGWSGVISDAWYKEQQQPQAINNGETENVLIRER